MSHPLACSRRSVGLLRLCSADCDTAARPGGAGRRGTDIAAGKSPQSGYEARQSSATGEKLTQAHAVDAALPRWTLLKKQVQ
ncbi:hypothetical protein AOLI_G00088060 [Acnodon oligacanthus]